LARPVGLYTAEKHI